MTDGLEADLQSYTKAIRAVERQRLGLDAAFDAVDVVITPPSPGSAPVGLHYTGSANLNLVWTLSTHRRSLFQRVATRRGCLLGFRVVARCTVTSRCSPFRSNCTRNFEQRSRRPVFCADLRAADIKPIACFFVDASASSPANPADARAFRAGETGPRSTFPGQPFRVPKWWQRGYARPARRFR